MASRLKNIPARKEVAIEKVSNGYVVSSVDQKTFKATKKIAKTKKEAQKFASTFLK